MLAELCILKYVLFEIYMPDFHSPPSLAHFTIKYKGQVAYVFAKLVLI